MEDIESPKLTREQDHMFKAKNININQCNKEEKEVIRNLKFRDIFYHEDIALSFTHEITHKINLTYETPIYTKSYRFLEIHEADVKSQINKMLQQSII